MVVICDKTYMNNEQYQVHFDRFDFPLSDFQKYAIESIVEGNHVLVTAHTGSGKTLPAEFAIEYFVSQGKKVIYTSPIKALSNQKYYEFTQKYPNISFGLITGDIKINPTAEVLIMTAEILMNYLFLYEEDKKEIEKTPVAAAFQIDIQSELACVVMDEIHYINDAERGSVWEKTILMLPRHIQMVMLSATIDSPERFASWCERDDETTMESSGKKVYLCSTNKRAVPLTHYGFLTTTEMIFKKVKDKSVQQQIKDTTNCLIKLQDEHGQFQTDSYLKIKNMKQMFESHDVTVKRNHVLNQLCYFLKENNMLPAIVFVFSRKNVELFAKEITANLLEDDSKIPYIVQRECDQIIRKLSNYQEYMNLPEYHQVVSLLEKGIGIHHSGMIPVLREIVELMISKKYIKVLFATESFAVGLSCPIRTAVFSSLTKFDGNNQRFLLAHEYTQSAGRAGRRGIDTVGHVVHCNNLFDLPTQLEYKTILGGKPQVLHTKLYISIPLVMNLLKNYSSEVDIVQFIENSMLRHEIDSCIHVYNAEFQLLETELQKILQSASFLKTPRSLCEEYNIIMNQLPNLVNKKRKEAERQIQKIKDEYRTIVDDAQVYHKITTKEKEMERLFRAIDYQKNYIHSKVNHICGILVDRQFISQVSQRNYTMTNQGRIALLIAEINPIVFVEYLYSTDFMKELSTKQIVGLFSCFTNIKVDQEHKVSVPTTEDKIIKNSIGIINTIINIYESYEDEYQIQLSSTTSRSDLELSYDMIDAMMRWCDCTDETQCKWFIQTELVEKSVSIGDFTKAVLKISTMSKELIMMCESFEKLEFMEKLSCIDSMILKYITTAQSLYL
jgi:superfamily II RNA helicase